MTLPARLTEKDMEGLPDWQAAAILSAPDASLPSKRVPVPVATLTNLFRKSGKWLAIKQAAAQGNVGAMAAVDLNDDRRTTTIDMDEPIVRIMLDLLVPDVLTAEEVDAAMALADAPQSWAEVNGVAVDARAVGLARGSKP